MNGTLVKLTGICPTWTGSLVPSAFAALQEGLRRERSRLGDRPFVALLFQQDYDCDGLTESLELLDSFSDQAAAVRCVERTAETKLAAALAQPSYGPYSWRLADWKGPLMRLEPRPASPRVTSVFAKTFKLVNGSEYDSKYFAFEVLHVTSSEVIGPDLFAFVNAEAEWVWFLSARGQDSREPR